MSELLRPYLSRILAPVFVWIAGWIASKLHIIISPDQISAMTEFVVILILVGVGHKAIDSKINPVDAARVSTAATHSDNPKP